MYYAQLLDIQPDEYEAQMAPFLRRRLRKLDTKPLTGIAGGDDLCDKKGNDGELLCVVGETPQLWMYGAAEMQERTVRVSYDFHKKYPEVFPFNNIRGEEPNETVHRLNYAEIRLICTMLKYERQSKALHTDKADHNFSRAT